MYLNMSAIRIYNNMHKQVIPSGNKSLFYILDVRLLLNVVEKEEKRKGMNVNGTIRKEMLHGKQDTVCQHVTYVICRSSYL